MAQVVAQSPHVASLDSDVSHPVAGPVQCAYPGLHVYGPVHVPFEHVQRVPQLPHDVSSVSEPHVIDGIASPPLLPPSNAVLATRSKPTRPQARHVKLNRIDSRATFRSCL